MYIGTCQVCRSCVVVAACLQACGQLGQNVVAVLGHAKPTWQACVLSVFWSVYNARRCRQGRQASLQAEDSAVAAAADKQQNARPEAAAAAAVASTAAEDAGGRGREAVAAEPAGPQPDSQAPGGDVVAVKGTVPFIVCMAGLSLLHRHPSPHLW